MAHMYMNIEKDSPKYKYQGGALWLPRWRSERVAVAPAFVSNFYMPANRKTLSPLQTGISILHADKKARNNSEESAGSSDIVLDTLNMAESVTVKVDRIMERLDMFSLIDNRLDSMASYDGEYRVHSQQT